MQYRIVYYGAVVEQEEVPRGRVEEELPGVVQLLEDVLHEEVAAYIGVYVCTYTYIYIYIYNLPPLIMNPPNKNKPLGVFFVLLSI